MKTLALFLLLAFAGASGAHARPAGVNMSGTEYYQGNFPTSADWQYLARIGVTFVRMPIAWESIQPTLNGALDPTFLGNLKASIALAKTNGIVVIVDLHNFGCYTMAAQWGNPVTVGGNGCGLTTGVHLLGDGTLTQANLVNLWTQLAKALNGTAAGYDIMNEPSWDITGTNLLSQPNGLSDTNGCPQCWTSFGGSTFTQLSVGSNPINPLYAPAWQISSGTGFGSAGQTITLGSGAYTCSVYAKAPVGGTAFTIDIGLSDFQTFSLTTSWAQYSYTATPGAGSTLIQLGVTTATPGVLVDVSDPQCESGTTATAFVPSTWYPYVQAAITGIRTVDTGTTIYVEGQDVSCTAVWPSVNWEMAALSGGPFVFEGHDYFDTNVVGSCGGGVYSGDFNSYGISVNNGVNSLTPFLTWGKQTGSRIYVGEVAIPNTCCVASPTGGNQNWSTAIGLFENALASARVPATMWYYNTVTSFFQGAILTIGPTSGPTGGDDPRLIQFIGNLSVGGHCVRTSGNCLSASGGNDNLLLVQ